MDSDRQISIGTSGLVLPVTKAFFSAAYRESTRLTYYASLLNSLEVNSSFYKLPMASTVKKWADEVPENFRFTFKLWKEITHVKNLEYKSTDVERFMDVVDGIDGKKGCLLLQFPAGLKIQSFGNLANLLHLVHELNTSRTWKIAVELRDKSWYQSDVYNLLDDFGASMVIHDFALAEMVINENNSDFIYLRFHGPEGNYRGSYSNDFLFEYAQYIKECQADGKIVYIYFNNTAGDAFQNLFTLKSFL
jgi:uncharacterized protein YecE (DUF72 family)